jgi:hypothetical protein
VVPSNDSNSLPYGFTYVDAININKNITEITKELLLEELGTKELSDAQIKVIKKATASGYHIIAIWGYDTHKQRKR